MKLPWSRDFPPEPLGTPGSYFPVLPYMQPVLLLLLKSLYPTNELCYSDCPIVFSDVRFSIKNLVRLFSWSFLLHFFRQGNS